MLYIIKHTCIYIKILYVKDTSNYFIQVIFYSQMHIIMCNNIILLSVVFVAATRSMTAGVAPTVLRRYKDIYEVTT